MYVGEDGVVAYYNARTKCIQYGRPVAWVKAMVSRFEGGLPLHVVSMNIA